MLPWSTSSYLADKEDQYSWNIFFSSSVKKMERPHGLHCFFSFYGKENRIPAPSVTEGTVLLMVHCHHVSMQGNQRQLYSLLCGHAWWGLGFTMIQVVSELRYSPKNSLYSLTSESEWLVYIHGHLNKKKVCIHSIRPQTQRSKMSGLDNCLSCHCSWRKRSIFPPVV